MPPTLLEVPAPRRAEPVPRARRDLLPAVAGVVIPVLVLAVTGILRYQNGQAGIDLVVFDQGIWAASRGMFSVVGVAGESLLEDHFGPGLLGFALLYRIVATPLWLLAGQAVAAGAAGWLVVRRLQPTLGPRRAGLVGAALMISPPVAYALLFDVHSVVFAIPFALGAVFALEDGRPRPALVLGLLAASFRIEVGLAVLVAFAVWPGRTRTRLLPGMLLGSYVLVAMYFEKALGHDAYWPIHYGHLGASPLAALRHPGPLLSTLFSETALNKALPWLATGALLCLKRPRMILPAAVLALPVLLSRWPGTAGVVFQYGIAPTFLLALAWVPQIRERPKLWLWPVTGCAALAVLLGPFTPGFASSNPRQGFLGMYWAPAGEIACMVDGIPAGAGVSGGRPITMLARREHVYLWPYPFAGTPADVLPAEHLRTGDPARVAAVDYLVIDKASSDRVPHGFVEDGAGDHYARFRRVETTRANPADCSRSRA